MHLKKKFSIVELTLFANTGKVSVVKVDLLA
jgi:hypothetical protein